MLFVKQPFRVALDKARALPCMLTLSICMSFDTSVIEVRENVARTRNQGKREKGQGLS